MDEAKINEETGEVISEGYWCRDRDCNGCICHICPPCTHCVEHFVEVGDNVHD